MTDPQYGEPEFLCYQVIKQVREQYGPDCDLPKTTFFKLSYISNERLKSKGIEVGLPVHWYQYGGVLTEDALQTGFYESSKKKWSSNTGRNIELSPDIGEDDFDVAEERKTIIHEEVFDVVNELGGRFSISIPQDYQYENHSPTDFIRVLHEFRDYLENLDAEDSVTRENYVSGVETSFSDLVGETDDDVSLPETIDEDVNDEIRSYLDELIRTYDDERYQKMESAFLDWENLTWQMARNGMYSQLYNFLESFWESFSRVVLRLKHEENNPLHVRSQWRIERDEELEKFEEHLEEQRGVVMKNREDTAVLNSVAESYSDTVREMFGVPAQNEGWDE